MRRRRALDTANEGAVLGHLRRKPWVGSLGCACASKSVLTNARSVSAPTASYPILQGPAILASLRKARGWSLSLVVIPGVVAAAACGVVCGAWGGGPSTWRPLAPKISTFARLPGAIRTTWPPHADRARDSNSRIARRGSRRACFECCAPAPALAEDAFGSLVEWLEAEGGSVSGCALRLAGSVRELVATRPIACGEVLAFVPRHCQLEYSWRAGNDQAPASLKDVIQRVPPQMWALQLGLVLVRECLVQRRSGSSAYQHYLRMLPSAYGGLPLLLDDVDEVQVASVVADMRSRQTFLDFFCETELEGLEAALDLAASGDNVRLSAEDDVDLAALLHWAVCTCSTRGFKVREDSGDAMLEEPCQGGHLSALVPIVDLCNHGGNPNLRVLPGEKGTSLQAKRPIAAGEPLLINYGGGGAALPNRRLFADYGFVLPDNIHDTIRFSLGHVIAAFGAARLRTPGAFAEPPDSLSERHHLQTLRSYMLAHVAQEEEVAPVDLGVWLCRNGSFAVAAWALARVVSADTLALAQRVSDTGMS